MSGSMRTSWLSHQFGQPPFEKAPLRLLLRQREGALRRRRGPRRSAPAAGTDRRAPRAPGGSRPARRARGSLDQRQAGRRAVAHRHRHGAVQLDHRRRVGAQQHVVQRDDLRPVGRGRAPAPRRAPPRSPPAARRGRTPAAASACSTSARPFGDLRRGPTASGPGRRAGPGRRPATCAPRAAIRAAASAPAGPSPPAPGSSSHQQPPQPDRLAREIVPRQRRRPRTPSSPR